MNAVADCILAHLKTVAAERDARARDPALQSRVLALKAYQQARFRHTYADMLSDPRYRDAAMFFLEDLYGPDDFSARDAQFARIVSPLVRLFPEEIVGTVLSLAELHALSETLDTTMAMQMQAASVDAMAYISAWQRTGRPDLRADQIRLTLDVGRALDKFTRNPVLRHTLRVMRGPARAAGLSALQAFLERGFDTFRAMKGADHFLGIVAEREEALRRFLFCPDTAAVASPLQPDRSGPLGQLP